MLSGDDGITATFLKRELEASLVKIDSLEKENHELKQEMSRLKAQINTLKAHDLERKSLLWKKLQTSMDCGKVIIDEAPQKPKLQVDVPIKKSSPNHTATLPTPPPSPPQLLQRRVTAPPPHPPPLQSTPVGSKTVRRVPAVMEFYRSLMKRDTQKENKNGATGFVPATNSRDMIGEIENRSTYLTSIKSDVEKHGPLLNFLTREVESAAFTEISDVESFVKWVDGELSCLVDERAVLKHFPQWPERKADALREAAFSYRDLKNLESQVLGFKNGFKQPLIQSLRKMQALQDRLESSISGLERSRESTSKRYKELQIPWQWLMDTGVVGKIKLSSLKLARECMQRIAKELECNESSREGDLLLQGVRFAFRVHQFAGGFDTETMHAFEELKEIGSNCS
ncbi:hypothetical protein L1987_39837 [Smallanthus sonchifolius]|uniref:Uncharacterized protein n=1 Tax=Smallanthus sonchifolius TaxID=185202 RepID=A0ACB9GTH0_9ASTR|nr:hypothetical protein L1987_39837 [Smallanthus sonchifolius]